MYGEETAEKQYSEYSDFFLHNENQSTIKIQTDIGENPPKSDGVDEMVDMSRTRSGIYPGLSFAVADGG